MARFARRYADAFTVPRGWWILGIFWAAVMAWSHRRDMDPDGLGYLEMAGRAAHGEIGALINGYWSPGYPAIESLALKLFRSDPRHEFQVIHLVNFLIFVAVIAAFTFFFQGWIRSWRDAITPHTEKMLTAFSFFIFLWSVCEHSGVGINTPDLAVCGIVFVAAGLVVRVDAPTWRWMHYVGLGLVLAAGYALKAAMFPAGLALLAILIAVPPGKFAKRSGFVAATVCFAAASFPLIVLTSRETGHLAFSDTGTLNYAWYVDGVKPYWEPAIDPRVTAIHPPRRISEQPVVLEFAEPFHVTDPLWYEPSYWAAGTRVWFDPRRQLAAIETSAGVLYLMLLETSALLAGAAVLYFLMRRVGAKAHWGDSLWCLLWPAAYLAMYTAVHIEWRFMGAFLVLFWCAVYRILIGEGEQVRGRAAVLAVVCGTLAIPWLGHFAAASARAASDMVHERPTQHERVADLLTLNGLHPGDRIAFAGESFEVYFARLARVRIVAQIPDQTEFWALDENGIHRLGQVLTSTGVKAVVAMGSPPEYNARTWQGKWIPAGQYSILPIGDLERP